MNVLDYRVEYAVTGRACCKGPKPCNGTPVRSGTLRFGVMVTIYFDTNWHWKHWGCVTKRVINNMKKVLQRPQDLDGYSDLRHEDQDKVVAAWDAGHVADEDIPDTARKHPLIPATVDQEAALPAGSIKVRLTTSWYLSN
ncbi:hypothetical protein BKA62DRAFT_627225 [Auriculariales sp. MPI-PUGE-AT-0066]|nr:hypothetical protein BKA62DRAFT_627225 [Auriculariales sp. MPI-PUGE-AT-0066]